MSGRSASAFSSRRLPMKHHGQTTSETTSIGIGIGGKCGVDITIPRLSERKLSFASISCNQVLDGRDLRKMTMATIPPNLFGYRCAIEPGGLSWSSIRLLWERAGVRGPKAKPLGSCDRQLGSATMGMKQTLGVLNRMEAEGIIGQYAISGAFAAYYYVEPTVTEDLDSIHRMLYTKKHEPSSQTIYKRLRHSCAQGSGTSGNCTSPLWRKNRYGRN